MNNLEKIIQKELEKKVDKFVKEEVFPKFLEIMDKSIWNNFYNLYSPLFYRRQWRFKKKENWKLEKNNGEYEIFINENITGNWKRKKIYLPKIATDGLINRRENGKITNTPRPFITDLKNDLKANQIFQNLLNKMS